MFDRIVNGGNIPALERALQLSSARQTVIANNIANIETPGFRPTDVSPVEFQQALAGALATRQKAAAAGVGYADTDAVDGGLALAKRYDRHYGRNHRSVHPRNYSRRRKSGNLRGLQAKIIRGYLPRANSKLSQRSGLFRGLVQ